MANFLCEARVVDELSSAGMDEGHRGGVVRALGGEEGFVVVVVVVDDA